MTLEQQAVADQVRRMREEADAIEEEAMECGDLEDQLEAAFEAHDLRANADRLEKRAQEAVNVAL